MVISDWSLSKGYQLHQVAVLQVQAWMRRFPQLESSRGGARD